MPFLFSQSRRGAKHRRPDRDAVNVMRPHRQKVIDAAGQATSFNEIVDALNEALGTNHKPDYFDNPYPFYQNFTQADMSHHERMTGFRCKFTTREGILDYVRNYLLKTSPEH